jgi:hypothetical protein
VTLLAAEILSGAGPPEVSYLLTGKLPPVGTSCPQDAVPFPSPATK